MVDKKYIELINKKIDGLINQVEKAKLQQYIIENPEAHKLYNEMIRTAGLLDNIDEVEPSINLKKQIFNSIDTNLYKNETKKSGRKSVISILFPYPKHRLAFAFATGIAVGLLIYSTILINFHQQQQINITDLYGTIGINEKVAYEILEIIPVESSEIKGDIKVNRAENIILFEIDLSSAKKFEFLVEFKSDQLIFNNFIPLISNEYLIDNGENYVRTVCSGDNKFAVTFHSLTDEFTNVNVKLIYSGNLLIDKEISFFKNDK